MDWAHSPQLFQDSLNQLLVYNVAKVHWKIILTVQDCSFRNHLLDMILGLREYEEDIGNTALDDFCQLPIFIESTT